MESFIMQVHRNQFDCECESLISALMARVESEAEHIKIVNSGSVVGCIHSLVG